MKSKESFGVGADDLKGWAQVEQQNVATFSSFVVGKCEQAVRQRPDQARFLDTCTCTPCNGTLAHICSSPRSLLVKGGISRQLGVGHLV